MTERAPLRDRLLALRADLLHQLDGADVLEPGWLNTLAGIAAALDGLNNAISLGTAEPMARAIVTDIPGEPLALTLYAEDGRAVAGSTAVSLLLRLPAAAPTLSGASTR